MIVAVVAAEDLKLDGLGDVDVVACCYWLKQARLDYLCALEFVWRRRIFVPEVQFAED